MNQALMEAIKTTEVLGAGALEETRALRQLVASANARIEELAPAAKDQAKAILSSLSCGEGRGEVSKFLFDGHHFELRRAETFDFVGKPQKYTMPEGVAFRQKTRPGPPLRHAPQEDLHRRNENGEQRNCQQQLPDDIFLHRMPPTFFTKPCMAIQ